MQPKRHARPDQYARRLTVWDVYQKCPNFVQAATSLGMPPTTFKRIYAMAQRDILGVIENKRIRQKRFLSSFDPQKHFHGCPICLEAQTAEAMCEQARAYITQDHVSQRERPFSHANPDTGVRPGQCRKPHHRAV